MKKWNSILFLFFFCVFFLFSPLSYAREKNIFPTFIDYIGKGNTGITHTSDLRTVFYNPACILNVENGFYLFDFTFANSKLLNEIYSAKDNLSSLTNRIRTGENFFGYINLSGPLYVGFKVSNIQLVVFHTLNIDVSTYFSFLPYTDVYANINIIDDIGAAAGFSFPLPIEITGSKWEKLYWGFSTKIFQRIKGKNTAIHLTDMANMGNPIDFLTEKLNPARTVSITTDIGAYYSYENLELGAVVYNLASLPMSYYPIKIPTVWKSSSDEEIAGYYDSLKTELGIGASYEFKHLGTIPRKFLKDLVFSIEFNDLFNNTDYPLIYQKIRLGGEITLSEVIFLRLGFLHGSFAFGIGYQFFIFKIESSFWQEKIGRNTMTNWGIQFRMEF